MSVLKRWLALPALLLVLALFGVGSADEDLKFDEKHIKAAEAIASFYAPSFDHMDHLLKTRVGYDHPGIAEEDWRGLPPLFKLETAYLSAERADKDGGERMLALLAKSLSQEYEWMGTSRDFAPFLTIEIPEGHVVKFAEITLSDASENRPTLSAEAKSLAHEISRFCTAGSHARAVLINDFGIKPSLARTFVIERTLKDAIERAFEEIGDEQILDEKLRKFVAAHDVEYAGFAGNKLFDPWRGPEPPPEAGPVQSPPRMPSGGGGGMSWAKKDSGIRNTGFRFFEPTSSDTQPPLAESLGIEFAHDASMRYQVEANTDFQRLVEDKEKGYGQKRIPPFKEVTKNPRGLGGIILGNMVEDATGKHSRTLRWERVNGALGRLVVNCEEGNVFLEEVHLEHAVVAFRLFFSGSTALQIDPSSEAIGLLGAYDEKWVDFRINRDNHEVDALTAVSKLVVHPSIADLQTGRDLAFCDTFPRSLQLPFPESLWQEKIIANFMKLAENDPERLEEEIAKPLRICNGWKISDLPLRISLNASELVIIPSPEIQMSMSKKIPKSLLTMYTFEVKESADKKSSELVPIEGFETSHGPALLQYLTATQEAYQKLNKLVAVLAVARWARSQGATMEAVIPERTFEPTFGLAMHSDRVDFLTRDSSQFELSDVVEFNESYLNSALTQSVYGRRYSECAALSKKINEERFVLAETRKSQAPRENVE